LIDLLLSFISIISLTIYILYLQQDDAIPSPQKSKRKLLRTRTVRDWQLFLQLDEDTRKQSPEEDLKYLKGVIMFINMMAISLESM
jgi:hypothetical protein